MNDFPPSPAELRQYLDRHGLTSKEVGVLLQVNDRQVRYWMRADSDKNIPFTAWYTLVDLLKDHPP